MFSKISGLNLKEVVKPPRIKGDLTEDELVHRQLVRDVMSRIDFYEIRSSLPQDRSHFSEVFAAQIAGKSRPTAFPSALRPLMEKIESVLLELKAMESNDSPRMCQIEERLAEFSTARNNGYFSGDADKDLAAIIDISENTRHVFRQMNIAK